MDKEYKLGFKDYLKNLGILAIAPFVIGIDLIKDLVTGDYQKRENTERLREIRFQEKLDLKKKRLKKREELYKIWGDKNKDKLAKVLISYPALLEEIKAKRYNDPVGGSFTDFSVYYTNTKKRYDGNYEIISGPQAGENYSHYDQIDNNNNQGYSLDEIAKKMSDRLINQIVYNDTLGVCHWAEDDYKNTQKLIRRGTQRSEIIKLIFESTGESLI